ncbi:hypothetical protein JR316_0005850 [Psilocybe cubensis]|uniref:Uncharacterized protein n=2 Tax=Psilocybe cubensis TaxID=181762 RepID=A0ACB8H0C3_PSICU|nr:hypothetical protein JR316_0005850 [Psilocybe cubensis]KAH9481328.1 hypothetical protein JR316_0005850 [Psilocybe cubensis]
MPTPNIPERDVRSSKPRTLIRMISTKFTPRTVSVPALRSPPAAPRSAFSKEQRDAALRERGLLPPLPNRDLSTQEREQDRHIPIVELGQEESHGHQRQGEGEGEPSAADLVKKAWEAKNSQPRLPAAAAPPPPPAAAAEGAADVNEAAADPRTSLAIKAGQRESAESKRLSDSDMLRPSSLLADLSDEIQAFMFPLPPSLNTNTNTSTSTDKTDADADVSVPPPSTPAPRLRPPASKADPDPDHETDPSLLRVNNRDSCGGAPTEESHSDASIMTPSLDSTTQTLSSFSHRSSSGVSSASSSVNKKGCLQVRMAGEGQCDEAFSGDELGVVIEEDSVPPSPSLLSKALPAANIKFKLDPAMDKDRAERETHADQDTALLSPVKDSAVKAPPQSVERKKSMNPFKRAATMSGAHGKDENEDTTATPAGTQTPTPTPRRRITMASTSFASLSNLRRSVVGTLTKTPASAPMKSRGSTVVDGLPGSPTSPTPTTARAMQMSAGKGEGKPIPRVRQPQQLVMYNRGSILLETAGIEDEETRRMTELAFLG